MRAMHDPGAGDRDRKDSRKDTLTDTEAMVGHPGQI
jgi:hypothetical protein